MPRSPSIVPEDTDRDIYLVLDHFGILGRVWRERDDGDADRTTLIRDLLDEAVREPRSHRGLQHRRRLVARGDRRRR